jgi:uncharacterized Zn finger protein
MAGRSKTWWGQEFLGALERLMDEGRLKRGRSYSADYRLVRFKMNLGTITAKMKGNINRYFGVYETPYYNVEIKFQEVDRRHWDSILTKLGSNADWITHLILGEVPPTIARAFRGAKVSLLPKTRKEIQSSCSCPDWANPCKHVAGAYYRVASMLDRDPLVLFELRGMKRSTLLNAVAQSEFGAALRGDSEEKKPDLAAAVRSPRFPKVETGGSDTPVSDLRAFWRGRPLPAETAEDRQIPPVSALLLRREGDYPQFWHRQNSFIDAMADIYERVAKGLPKRPEHGLPFDR